MYDYYLKYNAVDGTLKKVISDGTETILTTDDLSGWEIVQEESKNVLVLKGLDFGTTCNYGLYVEGNESDTYVIRAQEDTNNSITVCYSGVEENSYGIYADSYNMNIIGVGALDVNVYTDNASISGMYASAFSIDTSSLNMNIKNTFQSGWNRAIYAKDTININSCIVDIDGVGEKVSAISSKLDMNLTTSNITVNIEAKTMNAIESTSGKVSFNKTILNCPSLKTTTDKSYVVYSYTLLEILNESDIDINFSSTECAETDSSYYTNKQVMLYSEMEINIDNSSIDITLDGYCVDVIIANQLGKYSLNGEINISNTSVNIDGNVNYVRGITTMFNQNDITLTGSNIVMNVAPKSNVSGYFSQYSCIYNDFRNINVVNTSVNLTLGETAIDESTVVRYAEGYGMFASRDIVMSSGSIIKVSGKGNDSEGIFYSDNITVNASKVDINLDSRISYNNNVFLAYENLNIINNSDIDIIVNSISTGTYKCSDTECTENHQYIQYGLNVENDLTITSSTLDMSLNSTRLMGIYCAGKTTITKGVLNCHDMLSTSQNSYIILSVGGLDILDNSDIDIDFTSTEASTVTKYDYNGNPYEAYAYTQYLIYSNGDINVNNSNINLDMDLCRGAGIECYGGNINIVNSKVDILDYKVDIFFGIEADEEYVADKTEYKGNILISNTKITMKGKQKYSEDKAYGIWSDWGAITIQESSKINIDMCANYIIGIEAYEKDVTFNDSYIDINTYSETSDSYTYGIYCSNAKVIMDKAIINMNIMTEGFTAIGTLYWSNESTDPDICITNSHIDIKGKGVTEDYGFGMSAGMRVNIDSSDVNIDIEGCVVRGIYGYQSVTIKNSNTIIYAGTESNSTTISCSQYSDENKKVSLLGGSAIFKGGMCAVDGNLTLDTSSDPNYGVIAASTLYDGSTLTEYNSANLSTYKYLVIGHNETYEYKYFASTGEIYANGSDTPLDATALADLGISIIKEGTSNVLVMNTLNITTSKDVALWTIGDVDIQLNDGSVNNLVTQGTTVADYYGIKVIGNIKLSGKGTLNLNKTSASDSDANYYGIYSYYDVNIEEENVDLADSKMKIIVSNQATIGNTYGLYASDTYTKCANVSIQVNENNSTSYGIYANNEIVMNDGQVEIIADKVVNVVPTLVNVAISDAVQDTTSIIPSDSNSIMNYNYVMIMPNYYLRYENGKMYINDSVTQASVVNWSVNLDGNLQLDNFIFKTVAKYGLCVVGVNTIALSENSSNYIDLKYMGQDTAYAIYSDSQLSIQSLDGDNKGTLYIDDCRSEKETGAIYSKENIIINQVDIVLSADVVTYKGIISDKAITFNKAVVNFADIKTKEGDSNVIQAKTGIDIINSSDIDVTFVSEDKTTYMYTNSYNQSFKKYKYTQNIIETYKNINITDSNVTMNNKACVSKGIVSYDGNISMTNANIDIITESDSAYVILADYKNEKMGASSVGKINILNSIINIDANQLVYEDDNINGGCVAINATNNAIEIKSSTIDLQMDLADYNGGLRSYEAYMSIIDSDIDITGSAIDGEFDGFTVYAYTTSKKPYAFLTVDNSDILIEASQSEYMWGLDAGGNINVINDSVVDIRANIYYEYAVCSDKNVYITDSEMLINLSEYEEESIAYTCSISGILYVTNSLLDIYSQGVYVEGISCSKGIEGTDSEINVKVDGNSLKYNYGIYTSDNINLTGCIFNVDVNGAASSVIETKGNIKFIDSNVCLDGDSEDIVGLIAEKNLVVGSSDVTIRAGKQAMNVTGTTTFNSTEEKDSTYIEASKIYKNIGEGEQYQDSEIIKYPGYCDTSYKYVKIGEIPSYYYQYNANTDTVNKVLKNGTTTDVTSILPIGMLIYTDTDGSKYLQLADYSFVTSAAKTLDVVGAATIQLNGVNSLRTVDNSDTVAYGIYADSTLNIKGTGTLDITSIDYGYKTSTNTYKSIYSLGDIFIEDVGINNKIQYNMFSGIEGQNISLVGTSISYDANVQQRGVGMESTGNINITNKSTLQGTMLSDLAESDIKFINVKNGELIVNDSKFDNIVITADKANGIYAEDCNVTLDNTTMDIKITSISTTNYMYSYIIYTNTGGNITIKDSNVVGLLDTGYGLAIGPTQKLLIDNSVVNIDVNEHCKGNQYTLIRGISAVIFEEINSSNITLKISSIKDVWGVSLSNYKAVNGSYMKVDNSSLIIETLGDNAQNKAIYNSGSGDIIITSSNVELRANGIDGRGIMANSKLEVSNSSFISQGTEKSLSIIGNGFLDIKGKVEAGTDYDGSNKETKIDLETNYSSYKYVKIEPSVISVTITWGALDYEFEHGTWNTSTLQYDNRGWNPTTTDGDKISVKNDSNVPVNATVKYISAEDYVALLNGSLIQDKVNNTALPSTNQILVGSTLDAYLRITGELTNEISKQVLGNVTITLTE